MPVAATNIRKAALLVRSLDAESAALLLAQLSPQEARAVRQAVRELGEVDPEEQAELARELRRRDVPVASDDNGVEISFASPDDCSEQPPLPNELAPAPPVNEGPFAWLEHGDLPTLANVLEREHLSTVAVVLSHLPAERAAALLAALPPGRRAAALERLADLGESDRASLEVIEKSLADWISRQKRQRQMRADRLHAIRQILAIAPQESRKAVLAELARSDSQLATEIGLPHEYRRLEATEPIESLRPAGQTAHLRIPRSRMEPLAPAVTTAVPPTAPTTRPAPKASHPAPPPPTPLPHFEFWQIGQLDRRELALLLGAVDPSVLVLALAGGSDEIMRHVTRQLPSEIARELTRRVNHLNQISLADVAKAQQKIALTAAELTASGRLAPRGPQ